MTYQFSLRFTDNSLCSLEQIVFEDTYQGFKSNSIRGNFSLPGSKKTTFKWTKAVKAITLLSLKHSISSIEDEPSFIEGVNGSLASSLDFCLSKKPIWLSEIFGTDSSGKPTLLKLIYRENPERKRPGPVRLYYRNSKLKSEQIMIHIGKRQASKDDVEDLIGHLELEFSLDRYSKVRDKKKFSISKKVEKVDEVPFHFASDKVKKSLHQIYLQELKDSLFSIDIYSSQSFSVVVDSILKNNQFQKLAGKKYEVISNVEKALGTADKLGIGNSLSIKKILSDNEPISVALTPAQVSSLSALRYLTDICKYNIDFKVQFSHALTATQSIRDDLMSSPPDFCTLPIGEASYLIGSLPKAAYQPFMILPGVSHRFVTPLANRVRKVSEVVSLWEDFSTTHFTFEDLCSKRFVDKTSIKKIQADAIDSFRYLKSGENVAAFLWFPHWALNKLFNKAFEYRTWNDREDFKETILFVRKDFLCKNYKRANSFAIALRDALLRLRTIPTLRERVIDSLLADSEYLHYLVRTSGLYLLEEDDVVVNTDSIDIGRFFTDKSDLFGERAHG